MEKSGQKIRYILFEKYLYIILKHLLSALFGYIISKAGIKSDISPFSLSLFSISPFIKIKPLPFYIGSFIGFITKDFSVNNFKYICANTVMLVIILLFKKPQHYKKIYSPILPGIICASTGFIFLFANEISIYLIILLICESVLAGCLSYFLKYIFNAGIERRKFSSKDYISLNILILILVCATDNYYIYGIPLSFVFCITVIYLCCYYLERFTALWFTATICLILAILHPMSKHYFLLLFLPSVVAILISKFEKKHIVTSYYLTFITVLCYNILDFSLVDAISPLISAVIYILIPKKRLSDFLENYMDIYNPKENKEENNNQTCETYNKASQNLVKTFENSTVKPILNSNLENKIKKYLHRNNCTDVNLTNYYNETGRQVIALFCKTEFMFSSSNVCKKICEICNNDFIISDESVDGNNIYIRFEQKDRYSIECSALYKAKNGENVCGDNVCAFKSPDGRYNLILADGMGSGKDAYTKSLDTVTLFKKLIKSGIDRKQAIQTINLTLEIFKDDVGFSTIDLCSVSLFDGSAEIFKCGAYVSIIIRDGKIIQISGGGFPVGLYEEVSYTKHDFVFENNDIIIMMSDGLSAAIDKIQACILTSEFTSLEVLTREIIDCAYLKTPADLDDDMTVLAARVTKYYVE